MRLTMLALVGFIPACQADETVTGYGAADATWALVEQNGTPFTARATLNFGEDGQVSGMAPCNRFSTTNTVPYPWFDAGPIVATKMACPDLASETAFFETLRAMTLAEVLGDTLILRNDAGVEMVFKASE